MATIDIPDSVIFPSPKDDREAELFLTLQDYFTQLRQTLIEIESKL